jgi:hypothetical protein
MSTPDNTWALDIMLLNIAERLADNPGIDMANWYQGRAQGTLSYAELIGDIDSKTERLLHEIVNDWFEFAYDANRKYINSKYREYVESSLESVRDIADQYSADVMDSAEAGSAQIDHDNAQEINRAADLYELD